VVDRSATWATEASSGYEEKILSPGLKINVELDPATVGGEIEGHLLASLGGHAAQGDRARFGVIARDEDARLLGGLIGSTSYGWLLIKMLWVAEAARGQGLGTRLMKTAEATALARGCHGAWLDTSGLRAAAFYCSLGYRPFGTLENRRGEQPEGHRRFFLCKRLND
jgi:GNAT superfamily N-acetyltransferase